MLKVLIIDQFEIIRIGLEQIIQQTYQNALICHAGSADEALVQLITQPSFDIVVLADNLKGTSPEKLIRNIQISERAKHLLILSDRFDFRSGLLYYELGVSGYASKLADENEIMNAINLILGGKIYFSSDMVNAMEKEELLNHFLGKKPIETPDSPKLTIREAEILNLIVSGKSNHMISKCLYISYTTVSTHKRNIFKKFNVADVVSLVKKFNYYDFDILLK